MEPNASNGAKLRGDIEPVLMHTTLCRRMINEENIQAAAIEWCFNSVRRRRPLAA